jgi:DNA-binding PadR family transcriptional regulator
MGDRAFLGEFEQVVLLAVLQLQGDGYGMSIRREIERRTDRSVSIGSIYATLERLGKKGYLGSREGEATPVRGGRARRHFSIKPEGTAALARTRAMIGAMWRGAEPEADPERA